MELKIYSPQDAGFIQRIDWNFEELKAEITAARSMKLLFTRMTRSRRQRLTGQS